VGGSVGEDGATWGGGGPEELEHLVMLQLGGPAVLAVRADSCGSGISPSSPPHPSSLGKLCSGTEDYERWSDWFEDLLDFLAGLEQGRVGDLLYQGNEIYSAEGNQAGSPHHHSDFEYMQRKQSGSHVLRLVGE
jgi:hypothetical protein